MVWIHCVKSIEKGKKQNKSWKPISILNQELSSKSWMKTRKQSKKEKRMNRKLWKVTKILGKEREEILKWRKPRWGESDRTTTENVFSYRPFSRRNRDGNYQRSWQSSFRNEKELEEFSKIPVTGNVNAPTKLDPFTRALLEKE